MAGSGVFAEIIDGDMFKYYDEGEWKKSSSGKAVSIINPTTRKTQYKVQGTCFHAYILEKLMVTIGTCSSSVALSDYVCMWNWGINRNFAGVCCSWLKKSLFEVKVKWFLLSFYFTSHVKFLAGSGKTRL